MQHCFQNRDLLRVRMISVLSSCKLHHENRYRMYTLIVTQRLYTSMMKLLCHFSLYSYPFRYIRRDRISKKTGTYLWIIVKTDRQNMLDEFPQSPNTSKLKLTTEIRVSIFHRTEIAIVLGQFTSSCRYSHSLHVAVKLDPRGINCSVMCLTQLCSELPRNNFANHLTTSLSTGRNAQ